MLLRCAPPRARRRSRARGRSTWSARAGRALPRSGRGARTGTDLQERVGLDRSEAALARPGELLVEEAEHLVDRGPPEEHRAAYLVPGLDLASRVIGRDRVCTTRFERDELRSSVASGEFGETHELPGVRKICVAPDRFEHGDRPTRNVVQRLGVRRRPHERDVCSLHLGSVLRHLVVVVLRGLDRLGKGGVGGLERADAAKRPAEIGEQRRAFGGLDRKEPACALQLRRRRRELAAIEHAPTSASEEVTSFQGVRASLEAEPTELDADAGMPARSGIRRSPPDRSVARRFAPRARWRAAYGGRRGVPSAWMHTRRLG